MVNKVSRREYLPRSLLTLKGYTTLQHITMGESGVTQKVKKDSDSITDFVWAFGD